jgi:hypothetical protein
MSGKRLSAVVVVLLFFRLNVDAQLVDVETQRIANDTSKFSAVAALEFDYTKKNANVVVDFESSATFRFSPSAKHIFMFLGGYNLLKTGDDKIKNSSLAHFRYTYKFMPWLGVEAFSQYQSDEKRSLKRRILGGMGPRLKICSTKKVSFALGCLYMAEWEELMLVRIRPQIGHRLSSYVAANFLFGQDDCEFTTVTYYQPNLLKFNDFRILNDTSLDFHVSHYFSFGLTFTYNHDSFPPRGVLKDSVVSAAGVKIRF